MAPQPATRATLEHLLREQRGLATRRQLLDAGLTPAAIRWRLGHGWRMVLPGVVAAFTGAPDQRQRLIAGQLLAGPDGVISGLTAAAWHGVLAATDDGWVRLHVPYHRASRRHGFVRINRTLNPDPTPWRRGALTIANPARAVVDAAREARSRDGARVVVLEAAQRGIVRLADLRHHLDCSSRQGTRFVRLALQDAEEHAWSVPEADLLGALERSPRLPIVLANPSLLTPDGDRLPRPDIWLDDVALAVQVHSRLHHFRADRWEDTVRRDGLLGEHGVSVIGVTPAQINADLPAVVRRIERAHSRLAGRPRPPIAAKPLPRS